MEGFYRKQRDRRMKQRSFIITADDYGMCGIVNEAIDACIEAGLVRSTNVILNMDALDDAKDLRQRYPEISIGLHWNVTAGIPLLPGSEVPSLVNKKGEFHSLAQFKKLWHQKKIKPDELEKELVKQYDVFTSLCGKPDYWNTHQNSALDFWAFPAFNKLALRLGIDKTRSFQRTYVKDKQLHSIKSKVIEFLKKTVFDIWFGYIIPKSGTKLPDGRMIYFNEEQKLDIVNITDNVCWGKKRIVELVVHPATSGEYKYFGTISDMRVKEYNMFSDAETLKRLTIIGVSIVDYSVIR